jgi:hypothetical protein
VVGRRDELDRTKHFFCECARCVTVTAEPDSGFGVLDAQVSGILCQACGAGVLRPAGLLHDTAENNRVLTAMVHVGLGRIVAFYNCVSSSYQICYDNRCLFF